MMDFIWNFARKPLPSLWEGMNGFLAKFFLFAQKKYSELFFSILLV